MPATPKLKPSRDLDGCLAGRFRMLTGQVDILVSKKASQDDSALELFKAAHQQIDSLVKQSKAAAARDLLDLYNENWRVYQSVTPDGETTTIENPVLPDYAFRNKLVLRTLEVNDSKTFCLWFDASDLFGNHDILVTYLDGLSGECSAQIWG